MPLDFLFFMLFVVLYIPYCPLSYNTCSRSCYLVSAHLSQPLSLRSVQVFLLLHKGGIICTEF